MAKLANETDSNSINLVGIGTVITGDINSNGDIRIDGTLNGNLVTKGKVVIGETGKANGEINCKNSDVSGEIEGKIIVSELLSLKATSKINGDIIANKLAIEPGAKFTGNCNMNGKTSSFGFEEKQEKNTEQKGK
ncbi:MAG TPA: polymer-forming cytoskeletal protein [Bacteroidales bacterium]|nr:polymer-forming cytoskeletal protein [Bacteroidales bacterium]